MLKKIFEYFFPPKVVEEEEVKHLTGAEFCKKWGHNWSNYVEDKIHFYDVEKPLRLNRTICHMCNKIDFYQKKPNKDYIKIFDNPWKKE